MKDGFNRQINYARISLTSLCNLNCTYCSHDDIKKQNLPLEFYKNLINVLSSLGINKIRFTGGEPTLNKNIIELIKFTKNIGNINDIAITTNGILLDEFMDELMDSGLNRINFSLDTLDRKEYVNLTGSDQLERVISNIKLAKLRGLKVKINCVLLKGITDTNLDSYLYFGKENDIPIRFIELMPIGDNLDFYNKRYLSSEEIINSPDCVEIASDNTEVASYYRYKGDYDFGIISAISNHFCGSCNRIRITSSGKLRLCLHSDNEIDLLKYKDNKEMLYKILEQNIVNKPEKHLLNNNEFAKSSMVNIGG